jgi:hypothetical protein
VDVAVRIPDETDRTLAFEIFMTGEAKEVRGIARDVELFDEVVVCAPDAGALESLRNRARESLGPHNLGKVTFSLVSQYLIPGESGAFDTLDWPTSMGGNGPPPLSKAYPTRERQVGREATCEGGEPPWNYSKRYDGSTSLGLGRSKAWRAS